MASCWTKSGPAAGNRICRVWFAAAENRLALRQFGLAAELIDDCLRQWPQDENSWLLKLQYGFLTGDGALIRRTTEEIQRPGNLPVRRGAGGAALLGRAGEAGGAGNMKSKDRLWTSSGPSWR